MKRAFAWDEVLGPAPAIGATGVAALPTAAADGL